MGNPLPLRPPSYTQSNATLESIELLDQHEAMPALLEPRSYNSDAIKDPHVFTGYDDEDARAFGADNPGFGDDESKTSGLGPREGLAPQGLISELLGVLLSGCFLGILLRL